MKQHYPGNYASWRDLENLGDLQHNGAATCLVDFSKNLLVSGHLHNHVGLTENFDQSEDEEFLVNNTS